MTHDLSGTSNATTLADNQTADSIRFKMRLMNSNRIIQLDYVIIRKQKVIEFNWHDPVRSKIIITNRMVGEAI